MEQKLRQHIEILVVAREYDNIFVLAVTLPQCIDANLTVSTVLHEGSRAWRQLASELRKLLVTTSVELEQVTYI